jgi:hypothetical protein
MTADVTNADLPAPVLYRPVGKASFFALNESIKIILRPNESLDRLHIQFKNLGARRLIYRLIVPNVKPKDPAYFGIDDIVVAEVLLALFDLGVRNDEVAQKTSLACYGWDNGANPRPAFCPEHVSPIVAAIIGADKGES